MVVSCTMSHYLCCMRSGVCFALSSLQHEDHHLECEDHHYRVVVACSVNVDVRACMLCVAIACNGGNDKERTPAGAQTVEKGLSISLVGQSGQIKVSNTTTCEFVKLKWYVHATHTITTTPTHHHTYRAHDVPVHRWSRRI